MHRTPDADTSRAPRSDTALLAALYAVATWLTAPFFTADAPDYVDSVVEFVHGRDYRFWEFGHLLWRPAGYAALKLLRPLSSRWLGDGVALNAAFAFDVLAWLCGLLAVVAFHRWAGRLVPSRVAAGLATVALVFAQGVLNYSQSGTSYVPGLGMLLLGLWIVGADPDGTRRPWRTAAAGGAALAGAVFMWLVFLWALPAALLSPLVLHGNSTARRRLVALTTLCCGIVGLGAYAAVAAHLGIRGGAGFLAWASEASHGVSGINGIPRAVFGLARSVINMGNDGMLVKRFLLHDPYDAVTLGTLVRLSLWKLVVFYSAVGAVVLALLGTPRGRRVLLLLALNATPVVVFAVAWQGGEIGHYLPTYPTIFLAVGTALAGAWSTRGLAPRLLAATVAAFVAVTVVSNARALSPRSLAAQQAREAARLGAVRPRLTPQSLVVLPNWNDGLVNFQRSFPYHPANRGGPVRAYSLVTPGAPEVPVWRREFARRTLAVWQEGGDVWVSRRVFSERPLPEWNWVEGDDGRVAWRELPTFFAPLERGPAVGDEDGFVLLQRSPANERALRAESGSPTPGERASAQQP